MSYRHVGEMFEMLNSNKVVYEGVGGIPKLTVW